MFDILTVKYPLSVPAWNTFEYQTKSMAGPCLDRYEIRVDGALWRQESEHDEAPWEPSSFTGDVIFYANLGPGIEDGWIEFFSYFIAGHLTHLHVVKYREKRLC